MVDVVVHQGLFGLRNCLLDSVELLGDLEARPALLDHVDRRAKVTLCSLEALDDVGMALVSQRRFGHSHILSWWRGYGASSEIEFGDECPLPAQVMHVRYHCCAAPKRRRQS